MNHGWTLRDRAGCRSSSPNLQTHRAGLRKTKIDVEEVSRRATVSSTHQYLRLNAEKIAGVRAVEALQRESGLLVCLLRPVNPFDSQFDRRGDFLLSCPSCGPQAKAQVGASHIASLALKLGTRSSAILPTTLPSPASVNRSSCRPMRGLPIPLLPPRIPGARILGPTCLGPALARVSLKMR